jgi:hypothetical protein
MTRRAGLINVGLWVVIAILWYFLAEMVLNWPPLEIAVGEFVVTVRSVFIVSFCIFLLVSWMYCLRTGKL